MTGKLKFGDQKSITAAKRYGLNKRLLADFEPAKVRRRNAKYKGIPPQVQTCEFCARDIPPGYHLALNAHRRAHLACRDRGREYVQKIEAEFPAEKKRVTEKQRSL